MQALGARLGEVAGAMSVQPVILGRELGKQEAGLEVERLLRDMLEHIEKSVHGAAESVNSVYQSARSGNSGSKVRGKSRRQRARFRARVQRQRWRQP